MDSQKVIHLKQNMEFGITNKFIPNFCNATTLKITGLNDSSVRIEMKDANSKGVFPITHFQSLIRQGALILADDQIDNHGDTA